MSAISSLPSMNGHQLPSAAADILPSLLHSLHPATRVIHVGSGQGLGALHQWRQWHVTQALLTDPVTAPWVAPALAQHTGWSHCATVVAATEMNAIWHTTSNPAESGLLQPDRLQAIWPYLKNHGTEQRQTTTVDNLVAEHFPMWAESPTGNWLLVDCLPALPILQGALTTLENCSVVWVRVVIDPALPDLEHAQLSAVRSLLDAQQFKQLVVMEGLHPAVGEAIFVRNWPALLQDKIVQLQDQQTVDQTELSNLNQGLLTGQHEQNLIHQQLLAARDALTKEKADLTAARDAEATAKAEAIAQLDAVVNEKNQLAVARDALTKEKADLTAARDAEATAKAEAIAQRDAVVNEKNQLAAARDALTKEKADLTAARNAEATAKAEAIAQRDAALDEKNQLAAARDALAKEKADLTAARDEQVKLATERQHTLTVQQQEATSLQHRIQQLETDNYENTIRQQLQQEELIKAEAQIELIKDLLLREPGL